MRYQYLLLLALGQQAFSFTTLQHTRLTSKTSTTLHGAKTLGLLTFDLDDSLYPITPVVEEANRAFATTMAKFGFKGIKPTDILDACKSIREESEEMALATHTEVRTKAIRKEMEKVILKQKLQETADDWATPVSDLSPIVINFAKK
jgi:hypothetical protein